MKAKINNVAKPQASVTKNLALQERSRMVVMNKLRNASAIARLYEHTGSSFVSSLSLILGKLAYIHIVMEKQKRPEIYITSRDCVIDVHGHTDLVYLTHKEKHHLFQAVLNDSDDRTVISLAFSLYLQDRARTLRGRGRENIATMEKWLDHLGNYLAYLPIDLPTYLPTSLSSYRLTGLTTYLPTELTTYLPIDLSNYVPTYRPVKLPTSLRS
jgi:hypothetical protein